MMTYRELRRRVAGWCLLWQVPLFFWVTRDGFVAGWPTFIAVWMAFAIGGNLQALGEKSDVTR